MNDSTSVQSPRYTTNIPSTPLCRAGNICATPRSTSSSAPERPAGSAAAAVSRLSELHAKIGLGSLLPSSSSTGMRELLGGLDRCQQSRSDADAKQYAVKADATQTP